MLGPGVGVEEFDEIMIDVARRLATTGAPVVDCIVRAMTYYSLSKLMLRARVLAVLRHRCGEGYDLAEALRSLCR